MRPGAWDILPILHNIPPASDDLNSHPEPSDWRTPRMSVMRVIVFHPYTKFELRIGLGLSFPKKWLLFGHGVKRPGDLDL